jgi:PKD repeat protein
MTMRTTPISLLSAIALTALSACTVKDVDAPALAGPSTFAHSIVMFTERDTLTQNGVDFTDIRITSISPTGVSETIPLTAQIFVDGIAQDFGTLSTKNPITPATIRYTAPPASALATAQVAQVVTIAVTPTSNGDFRSEFARQIDLRLNPQGVILPNNPNLLATFTFTPTDPQLATTVAFDASATTNNGVACLSQCIYSWNFGDGTTGSGMNVTHEFRTVGNILVTLTVTDSRGATATATRTVAVAPGTPPTAVFSFSPSPVGANQDVFFSAENSTVIPPRRIVRYDWDFGDGVGGTGVSTTHRYKAVGTYTVIMTVTDDAGVFARATQTITVSEGLPVVALSVTGLKVFGITQLLVTATPQTGSTIVGYTINWGDGSPEEFSDNPANTHVYTSTSVFTIVVRTTDSVGRTRVSTITATVTPP